MAGLVASKLLFSSPEAAKDPLFSLLQICFYFGVPVYLLERYMGFFVEECLKQSYGQVKTLESKTNEKVRLSAEYLQTDKVIESLDSYWQTAFASHYQNASRETILANLAQCFTTPQVVRNKLASIESKADYTASFLRDAKTQREWLLTECDELRKMVIGSKILVWTFSLDQILGCLDMALMRVLIDSHDQDALDGYFSDMRTHLRELGEATAESLVAVHPRACGEVRAPVTFGS